MGLEPVIADKPPLYSDLGSSSDELPNTTYEKTSEDSLPPQLFFNWA